MSLASPLFIRNQIRFAFCATGLLLSTLAFVNCGREKKEDVVPSSPSETAALYDKTKGLFLPESLKTSMGLTTTSVPFCEVCASIPIKLQIFREATEPLSRYTNYKQGDAYASTTLPSDESLKLKVGRSVEITDPSNPGKIVLGSLFRSDESLKNQSGEIEWIIAVPDPENRFALGSFLQAKVSVGSIPKTLAVPKSALLQTADGTFVYLVSEKYFRRTAVEKGLEGEEFVEIRKGLSPGDTVVTKAVETLWLTELQIRQSSKDSSEK